MLTKAFFPKKENLHNGGAGYKKVKKPGYNRVKVKKNRFVFKIQTKLNFQKYIFNYFRNTSSKA